MPTALGATAMMRWLAATVGIVLGAGAGFLAGYLLGGQRATEAERVIPRLEAAASEASTLRDEKQRLEQRLEQVLKEQERLARENEILQQQRAVEDLSGQGAERPVLQPK